MRWLLASCVFVFISAYLLAAERSAPDETALKPAYDNFVRSLSHESIRQKYAEAVRKLDSADANDIRQALIVLAATCEPEVIPWIAPHLDSSKPEIQIQAGSCLEKIVTEQTMKRRDFQQPHRIVIKPLGPGDLDLRPMAWIALKLLRKPDDGNSHAYAATMIGYLGLREFEGELRALLKSRHPAVTRAARHALEVLDLEPLAAFSPQELAAVEETVKAFGKLFQNKDEDQLALHIVPKDSLTKIVSPELLQSTDPDSLYGKIVSSNVQRFIALRAMCGDLSKINAVSFQPGTAVESKFYAAGVKVMKNAHLVLADADRLEIKIKIEALVFVGEKCFIAKID